jgi:hypothetical protein
MWKTLFISRLLVNSRTGKENKGEREWKLKRQRKISPHTSQAGMG